ncbi:hypothetical protein J2X19_003303 [Rhodoferax ferrireducens]|uniref:Uncharacterized protein n=1 Tax=Rhodoferax ferrireducens TaxID=192843 RepID=A0ABU2CB96_9BURK|nr:hypothetical protein [Rhodoferax ferrireducens]MDR7378609.1 hypothetical protein [Rhodoferax ferrireducens]
MFARKLNYFLRILTLVYAAGISNMALAQTSVDDILRSGTNFGNKAFNGLLGGNGGSINVGSAEGNAVVQAISQLSEGCVKRLQRVLQTFGESRVAHSFHGYGWGNVNAVSLSLPLAVLGADVRSKYHGLAPLDDVLTSTENTRIIPLFDAECQQGTVTYEATIERYFRKNNELAAWPVRFKSSATLDMHSIELNQHGVFGIATVSNICHEIVDESSTQQACYPQTLDVYCQFNTCYSEPLAELVERGKISSRDTTGIFFDRVNTAEWKIYGERKDYMRR